MRIVLRLLGFLLLAVVVFVALLALGIRGNRLPLNDPPGSFVRLNTYLNTHVAETIEGSAARYRGFKCPHCKLFRPLMDQLLAANLGKVVTYFMQFPLEKHPDSKSAAQAALAAAQQGKFREMHELLFEKSPDHDHEHVTDYAKSLGLDLGKFEAAYNAEADHVLADLHQGENAGVDSTPTLFFNDRKYEGPLVPKYIQMWIDEDLAVNR